MLPLQFLILDDNPDTRFLLSKTLLRKFPTCVLQEYQDADSAVAAAGKKGVDLIVVHRLWDIDGVSLIKRLRAANPRVPIIAVSGIDRSAETLAAGATRFLHYDEWLRIGTVAAAIVGLPIESTAPFPPLARSK